MGALSVSDVSSDSTDFTVSVDSAVSTVRIRPQDAAMSVLPAAGKILSSDHDCPTEILSDNFLFYIKYQLFFFTID